MARNAPRMSGATISLVAPMMTAISVTAIAIPTRNQLANPTRRYQPGIFQSDLSAPSTSASLTTSRYSFRCFSLGYEFDVARTPTLIIPTLQGPVHPRHCRPRRASNGLDPVARARGWWLRVEVEVDRAIVVVIKVTPHAVEARIPLPGLPEHRLSHRRTRTFAGQWMARVPMCHPCEAAERGDAPNLAASHSGSPLNASENRPPSRVEEGRRQHSAAGRRGPDVCPRR